MVIHNHIICEFIYPYSNKCREECRHINMKYIMNLEERKFNYAVSCPYDKEPII